MKLFSCIVLATGLAQAAAQDSQPPNEFSETGMEKTGFPTTTIDGVLGFPVTVDLDKDTDDPTHAVRWTVPTDSPAKILRVRMTKDVAGRMLAWISKGSPMNASAADQEATSDLGACLPAGGCRMSMNLTVAPGDIAWLSLLPMCGPECSFKPTMGVHDVVGHLLDSSGNVLPVDVDKNKDGFTAWYDSKAKQLASPPVRLRLAQSESVYIKVDAGTLAASPKVSIVFKKDSPPSSKPNVNKTSSDIKVFPRNESGPVGSYSTGPVELSEGTWYIAPFVDELGMTGITNEVFRLAVGIGAEPSGALGFPSLWPCSLAVLAILGSLHLG